MTEERELAYVERAEVHWLPEGSPIVGRLLIVVHGRKPTPCHRIDIVPLRTDSPSFAVVWSQEGEFCITQETPYSYSEAFMVPQRVNEIILLCKGADGKTEEKRITVGRLESNSLRSLQRNSGVLASPYDAWPQSFSFMNGPPVPMGQEPVFPDSAQFSAMAANFAPITGPIDESRAGASVSRDSGDFAAEVKFWLAGYGRCQVFVERDRRRWVFNGQGGGAPGGGGYSGKIFTSSLNRLVSSTTSCALVAATFYGTIAFFDAQANVLGNFHGGGFGVGGGGYTGHWQ